MKSREFVAQLRALGAELVRKVGDHHVYRLYGETIDVPMGGSHTEAPKYLLARLRRIERRSKLRRDDPT